MAKHEDIKGTLQSHASWVENPHGGGRRADLRGADLRHVNMEGADFRWADCRAADFSGSNLSKADFRHADLRGANFAGAVCIGTSFVNARMDGVNMASVDLRAAVLDYAHMPGINLHDLREAAKAATRLGGKESHRKDRDDGMER
jgi:hypothetical protein